MGNPGTAGAQGAGGVGDFSFIIMMAVIFAIFYFLMIRPQQKKQKEHKQMLENLTRGDRVVTAGGLYGRVVEAKEDVLTLDLGNDMHVQVGRGFISGLVPADGGASKAKDKKK